MVKTNFDLVTAIITITTYGKTKKLMLFFTSRKGKEDIIGISRLFLNSMVSMTSKRIINQQYYSESDVNLMMIMLNWVNYSYWKIGIQILWNKLATMVDHILPSSTMPTIYTQQDCFCFYLVMGHISYVSFHSNSFMLLR